MIEGEGERERKIMSRFFFFEHTTKNKEEIQKTKFQKHSKRNHFLKKLPLKEIGKQKILDEKTRKRDFHFLKKKEL